MDAKRFSVDILHSAAAAPVRFIRQLQPRSTSSGARSLAPATQFLEQTSARQSMGRLSLLGTASSMGLGRTLHYTRARARVHRAPACSNTAHYITRLLSGGSRCVYQQPATYTYSASQRHPRSAHTHSSRPSDNALRNARLHAALTSIYHASYRPARQYITQCNMGTEQLSTSRHNLSCRHRGL